MCMSPVVFLGGKRKLTYNREFPVRCAGMWPAKLAGCGICQPILGCSSEMR